MGEALGDGIEIGRARELAQDLVAQPVAPVREPFGEECRHLARHAQRERRHPAFAIRRDRSALFFGGPRRIDEMPLEANDQIAPRGRQRRRELLRRQHPGPLPRGVEQVAIDELLGLEPTARLRLVEPEVAVASDDLVALLEHADRDAPALRIDGRTHRDGGGEAESDAGHCRLLGDHTGVVRVGLRARGREAVDVLVVGVGQEHADRRDVERGATSVDETSHRFAGARHDLLRVDRAVDLRDRGVRNEQPREALAGRAEAIAAQQAGGRDRQPREGGIARALGEARRERGIEREHDEARPPTAE